MLHSHENRRAADCVRTVKSAPRVRIYSKSIATIRVVLRDLGDGAEVWLFASDGLRRHEQFAEREAAERFQAQIHDTVIGRGYLLVWNSTGQGVSGCDAA
jgi:hypothetical protein